MLLIRLYRACYPSLSIHAANPQQISMCRGSMRSMDMELPAITRSRGAQQSLEAGFPAIYMSKSPPAISKSRDPHQFLRAGIPINL